VRTQRFSRAISRLVNRLGALAALSAGSAGLGAPLGEAEVIRAAAATPAVRAAQAEQALAEAQALAGSLLANPTIEWDREPGSGPSEQRDTWTLTVPIDASGRAAASGALGRSSAAREQAAARRAKSTDILQALRQFYALAELRARTELLADAQARFAEAARVLQQRVAAGNEAGVGSLRLELEAELAHSALRRSRARLYRLRHALAGQLGLDPAQTTFDAKLSPSTDLRLTAGGRPSSSALQRAEQHSRRAHTASARSWIPDLSLAAALRTGAGIDGAVGSRIGVGLALPLFDRGRARRAEAAAQLALSGAEVAAAQRADRVALRRAEQALAAARTELAQFDKGTGKRLESLAAATAAAGAEGLLSPLEVLDAERAQTDVPMRRLKLVLELKFSELALRAASGEFE
jgi:cobalt-zinc-cadmium efflux system outer membrane protein